VFQLITTNESSKVFEALFIYAAKTIPFDIIQNQGGFL